MKCTFLCASLCLVACGRIGYDPLSRAHGDADAEVPLDAPMDAPGMDADTSVDSAMDGTLDGDNTGDMSGAGIVVTPTSGLTTTEAGGTAEFTVVLSLPPMDDVVIALSSSNTAEGTVSPASLTFTTLNWNSPHEVTITGVDDSARDGDIAYEVITAPADSADPMYDGLDADNVSVTNIDNESPGVTLSRTSGLTTTEAGGTDTFTIALNIAPTSDVTISLTSDTPAEATVSPATVTFTSTDWASPQTVTVSGVDDDVRDGDVPFTIVTGDAASADPEYAMLVVADVTGSNLDDESPGILVDPIDGLTTSEAGGSAMFTVALRSQPVMNVTVPIVSNDEGEGTVSPAEVTFTPTSWSAQAITITGVDDSVDDGDQSYTVSVGPSTSDDPLYDMLSGDDVEVTNTDDESAGFIVTPLDGLTTTEGGGTATFTVVLRSEPSASVQFEITSTNTDEGTLAPAMLTFTTGNWNMPQTVTVTGVDDAVADGDQMYEALVSVSASGDADYLALSDELVAIINTDDESAGITVSPTSGLTTTEAGGTATFTVVLNSEPTDDVTIALSSDVPLEGTVAPLSITFTTSNWSTPQTITVTGQDDFVADGARIYHIVTAAAVSMDPEYSGRDASDVTVTNTDDDVVGITVTPTTGLTTTETAMAATFTVVLTSAPTAPVTISLMSSDTTEGTVSPASLMFTLGTWNVPQTVTVTGVDDLLADGNVSYSIITASAVSTDTTYSGINPSDVSLSNIDNDMASVVVTPTSGLMTSEAGAMATFTIVLSAQPTAPVSISLMSSDTTEGTIVPVSVLFDGTTWNMPQTVTVTGVDDTIVDGNVGYTIITGAATSTDTAYSGLAVADVSVSNSDNDMAGVTVTPTSGLVTSEAGGTATFTIVLQSEPTANVTISLMSSNTAEGTVAPASVVFTPSDWSMPHNVTITGVDDALADGNIAYTITTGAATSTDGSYSGLAVADVSVTNNDNDAPGVTVSPTAGLVTTEAGGMATFTIVLASMPTAAVSIGLSSSNLAEGTVSPASVNFTTGNWSTPQTVTVTGVDDAVADGNVAYSVVTANAVSTDMNYSGRVVSDVSVTNNDNDVAGVTVTPTSGLVTTEAGGTATFSVVLTSQPTANVSISLMSSNTAEGTVSPASLTFTNLNWSMPQTVTVTGVDDAVVDGSVGYSIVTGAATSTDLAYSGRVVSDVTVTNTDNDTAGVTVTPTSGLVTTEAGGTASFTVVLTSQPTANVSISLASNNAAEGTVSPASVTFTNMNWNMAQTVTVTGVDDAVVDGSVGYSIITGNATSTDLNYSARVVSDVTVTNTDNDVAGITVTPTSGLTTTEAGGTATFTIVLTSQPTANVSISLMSSNTGEGTVSPASVTFTNLNWSMAQTVTITGVNDSVDDGNIAYSIVTGSATSTDTNYNGRAVSDVTVTNTDNDTAGVTVSPTSGLTTTEAAGTATFTIVLASQPTANVSISLMSSNTGEGTVSPASVTFTNLNWSTTQTITVTGVNDSIVDGNIAYTIVTGAATSTDLVYSGMAVADVSVTNTDNDTAGVTVSPTSGLTTTEAGGTANFTVVLTSQPTAGVTISLTSSNTAEGTVSPASVSFTTMNWNTPQMVTVTGVNDAVVDGSVGYNIVTGAASSADSVYNGMVVADVSVTNTDNDVAGVTVTPTSGHTTTEAGATASFTIVLTSQPTANVSISLMSSDTTEGTVSPASVTFTNMNWNMTQTVTVTGVDDSVVDGSIGYTIVTGAATSTDGTYSGMAVSDVSVTNTDNDTAGVTVSPTSGLVTTEAGGTANFTIVLTSQPTADVTISLMSSNTSEGTVAPASVTFTTMNWSMAQTITVTGVNDVVADGTVGYSIITGAASSADGTYNGMVVSDVSVSNTDNDTAGVTVSPTSGLVTTEALATAQFTIVLNTMPSASVSISLMSSNTAEGTVAPASVTFTTMNWNTPQTVTVTGVNDSVADGNIAYSIVTGAASSADGTYNAMAVADVSLTNNDNDVVGVTVNPTSGLTTTEAGGTAMFTIVLNSQPTAAVTISLTSNDLTEGTVSPASVMFSTMNWNMAQTVTVTGVNDAVADGNVGYSIVTGAASSADLGYNGFAVADVSVTNNDNDVVGVTVNPTSGLTTTEAGGTAMFTIVLTSQPTADVVISLSSSNTFEGSVAPASVTFTTMNWSSTQMVTVTGVNDSIDDGDIAYSIVTGAAASADSAYNGFAVADVSLTNTDNDAAGVTVNPTSGLTTTEAGGTAMFTIVLTSQPTSGVTISLMSSDTTEGTVSPASVNFTTVNWNMAQTVTVTGVNDFLVDGAIGYSIVTGAASSSDGTYNGMAVSDVTVSNSDNDTAGATVTPTSGLVTTEALGTADFTIVLTAQPASNVSISLASSDTTEGTVAPASVTFTNGNWNIAQTVTVTGVDDVIDDGNVAYTITTGAMSSADGAFNGVAVSDVSVSNTDDDTAGVTVTPTSGLTTTEALGTANFTIVLTSQPTASVSISLASSDTTEGTVAPASVTFTTMNWNSAQMVTVTGVDDSIDDGDVGYTITTGAASSADGSYNGMAVSDVSITNTDNDTAGVTVTPTSGLVTTEALGTANFTIVLTSQPTASVSISLASSDTTEGTVAPASVTFTTMNWNSAQMVTVTGVDDSIDDGNVGYTITTGAASSADGSYNGLAVSDVSVTNTDNDTAGVTVTPTSGLVTDETGLQATFTMVLTSQPTASVTISLTSNDLTEGTVSPASVVFTTGNWNMAQTVTITGVTDALSDGDVAYTIVTGAASSADGTYNGMVVADVSVTNNTLIEQQAYIKASNAGQDDLFGDEAIALSADGNTMVVGAYREDGSGTGINPANNNSSMDAGAAYIFVRTGSTWTQQAYIKASNTGSNDYFGAYLAISSDGNTVAISAEFEDSNATGIGGNQANNSLVDPGAVYVFTRSGTTWTQQAYIKASNTGNNDHFGEFVSLSDDGDTLAVGATGEASNATGINGDQSNNSASGAGAVYVFTRSAGVWSQQAYVKASNTDASDNFGYCIALSSNGDTMAVGAVFEGGSSTGINGADNDSAASAGAVYVFVRSAGVWTQEAYVKASNTAAGDEFGGAVSISDDGNTLAVGAALEDSNATGIGGNQANNSAMNAGAVYVYTRSGTTWTQQAYIKASNTGSTDMFGSDLGVSLSGDGNLLAVGAQNEASSADGVNGLQSDNSAWGAGAAYMFRRVGTTWTQIYYIKASNSEDPDNFGWLSLSNDGTTLGVSAANEDSNATGIGGNQADNSRSESGAVYVFN